MLINERIREIRKTVGLTQSKFAERIAISNSYLGEIEHGAKMANERLLRLVTAEFNVDEHWLRTGEGTMFNRGFDNYTAELNGVFKSLSPQFKACALNQVKKLAELQQNVRDSQKLHKS